MTSCRFLAIILNAALLLSAAAHGFAETEPAQEESESGGTAFEAHASLRLGPRVKRKLARGFERAIEMMVHNSSCRELFMELESEGIRSLRYSIYVPVSRGVETRICEAGVAAFTEVGSSVTRLCPGFAKLADRRAAITLIHEALHFAGLSEKPVDPGGMTSDQITRLVARTCNSSP